MTRKFVTLRVWHPGCWMLDTTERHRDVAVESRGVCTHGGFVDTDAVVHAECGEALHAVLKRPPPEDVYREVLHEAPDYAEVYSHYPVARSVHQATLDTGFLVVAPVMHVDGYEYWQVLADSDTLQSGISRLREHAEVRVERIADHRAASSRTCAPRGLAERLREELSERQLDILTRATRAGYYDWPRGKNVKRLAEEFGIAGPTCLEHIRKAESRIVPAVLDEFARKPGTRRRP